jgi:hypothetical protein
MRSGHAWLFAKAKPFTPNLQGGCVKSQAVLPALRYTAVGGAVAVLSP